MAEQIRIYPENPSIKTIEQAVAVLRSDGIVVVPTDTVYSFACDLRSVKAMRRLARIKGLKPKEAEFSIVFDELSRLSQFTRPIPSSAFKTLKRCLPGPFTFILPASRSVPKLFEANRKTIGIRIPDHNIPRALAAQLDGPLVVSSVHDPDEVIEYTTDPELIAEKYAQQIELVLDAGYGDNSSSTVVDLTEGHPELIRSGKGDTRLLD
jgi:tRNA threonylcarbamoyl adenosine modification protein (Sua5/YciO/YrdC/YwlC family)